jgi:hypothetical protein
LPEVTTQGNNWFENSHGGEGTKPRYDTLLIKGNEGSLPERSEGNLPKLITLNRACNHGSVFYQGKVGYGFSGGGGPWQVTNRATRCRVTEAMSSLARPLAEHPEPTGMLQGA